MSSREISAETVPGAAALPLLDHHQRRRRRNGGQADVTLEPPRELDRVSSFLNLRVADIHTLYSEWKARGANFLTPPIQRETEIRCYIRDPDGHLIEVGQTTRRPG